VPTPPHTFGLEQSPQSMAWLHPSETNPHDALSCEHVLGVQYPPPQVLAAPPPPQV
jgi:hypothetical protein